MAKHYTIPIFVPELACPFQCVFCNQEKISGHQNIPDRNEIINTIEVYLKTFKSKKRIVEVGFFGGSFTGIPIDEQLYYLEIIKPFINAGTIQGIRLSTRPDYINDGILKMLYQNHVTTIELGAQSFDDDVLQKSFRGHTANQIEIASKMIIDTGFKLGLQMMIGLPGDTIEKAIYTANKIIESGAHETRLYPTLVIRDTALHKLYSNEKYKPLTLKQAVEWTKQILPLFEEAGVRLIRVGLHPSDGLVSGNELVDGPFHSSFKELVISSLWADLLTPLLINGTDKNIEIHVPTKEINYAIGHKSANKKMLLERFNSVKFVPEVSYSARNFTLKSLN
ncbi:MAG TPA: radical SAM protein [Bacteroidales bacterium]|jgi:histone acetyltransferase (RNA polymerase elongator complex component)|nr:radical SAM protein [Bacteroidota bacterium]HJN06919.1 radical SAM protein [Bacteroidales bacterium]|tara:strand:+ start:3192 stop:4202 length:1011 start_codon:yes stop_codon:yes gene_type:complete